MQIAAAAVGGFVVLRFLLGFFFGHEQSLFQRTKTFVFRTARSIPFVEVGPLARARTHAGRVRSRETSVPAALTLTRPRLSRQNMIQAQLKDIIIGLEKDLIKNTKHRDVRRAQRVNGRECSAFTATAASEC